MNLCILGRAGSGKTAAAAVVARYINARVIEPDELTDAAYAPNTDGWSKIVGHFGGGIVAEDGTINRDKLGQHIIHSPNSKTVLKSVEDSFIRARIQEEIAGGGGSADGTRHKVMASYLMVERRWLPDAFHHAVVITAAEDTCVARLNGSREWSAGYASDVVSSQMSPDDIVEQAKIVFGRRVAVLTNDGSLEALEAKIRDFLDSLLATKELDGQRVWAEFLESESDHLMAAFLAEEQRASWLLTASGALLALLLTTKPNGTTAAFSIFSFALVAVFLSVVFSLLAIYPIDGYKRLYGDLFGRRYRKIRELPIEQFLLQQARPGAWSMADYLVRVQYHYRSHWLITFRRKRMMAWATLLTLLAVALAAVQVLWNLV